MQRCNQASYRRTCARRDFFLRAGKFLLGKSSFTEAKFREILQNLGSRRPPPRANLLARERAIAARASTARRSSPSRPALSCPLAWARACSAWSRACSLSVQVHVTVPSVWTRKECIPISSAWARPRGAGRLSACSAAPDRGSRAVGRVAGRSRRPDGLCRDGRIKSASSTILLLSNSIWPKCKPSGSGTVQLYLQASPLHWPEEQGSTVRC